MPKTKRAGARSFDLVVFGEFFSDMIFYQLRNQPRFGEEVKTDSFLIAPGGGLATAAIAASRLGSVTGIVTRVGADASVLPTWNEILNEGLDVTACEVRKDQPTALTVSIAYHSNKMMVTHEPINQRLEELLTHKPVRDKLHRARHVHLACALRQPRKWIPVLKELREDGITLSADFGWNPDLSASQLLSIVRHCEFIFPNEHEAKAITGASDAMRALEKLQDWVRVPVIKLDKRGAMLMADGKLYRQPALPIAVVDATGAGDAFDGGFLHAFLHGADWNECLRAGNICGSLSASQPGGSQGLPDAKEYRRHLTAMMQAGEKKRNRM
ncbi:carbohydrate kinase family protein [Edaphobacter flagellatus]|uniref:carbohydrate kinase family protein n=1 Tax=Edaphobacter flagellatus TaxID=1933044 RepID=UPI0021B2AFDB|nr:PfkB family carbohydrate kinase [Edaphobacter flagellatus]